MLIRTQETAAQVMLHAELDSWIKIFLNTPAGAIRRNAAREIRAIAREHAWLADQLPQEVWDAVYHVRTARGTTTPPFGT